MKNKKFRRWMIKIISVFSICSMLGSFSSTVFAVREEGGQIVAIEEREATTTEATGGALTAATGYVEAVTLLGSIWGGLKVVEEWGKFKTNLVRPVWNSMQGMYYAGQNPFTDPLHIYEGINRVIDDYSLNEKNAQTLREFAAPIALQLGQAMRENGGVLPRNFAFAPDTIRALYLYGDVGAGKSRIVMDELPKVFLRHPKSAIIVSAGKGFTEGEDVVKALFDMPSFQGKDTHVKKDRTVGERIISRAGRGIVVFDDYKKYSTPALDKCLFSLHNEGKINTSQGEIDCPALLFLYSTNEREEDFLIAPERNMETIFPEKVRRHSTDSATEIIPEMKEVRTVGHPIGFIRRIRSMELSCLNGDLLRKALLEHFNENVLPHVLKGAVATFDEEALSALVKSFEDNHDRVERSFDMGELQVELVKFQKRHPECPAHLRLKIRHNGTRFVVRLDHSESDEEGVEESVNFFTPAEKLGRLSRINRSYGFAPAIRRFCRNLSSCFCYTPEELDYEELIEAAEDDVDDTTVKAETPRPSFVESQSELTSKDSDNEDGSLTTSETIEHSSSTESGMIRDSSSTLLVDGSTSV